MFSGVGREISCIFIYEIPAVAYHENLVGPLTQVFSDPKDSKSDFGRYLRYGPTL